MIICSNKNNDNIYHKNYIFFNEFINTSTDIEKIFLLKPVVKLF